MVRPVQIQPAAAEIYLDCNATTPVLPEVAATVDHVMADIFGNPSSSHITGLKARYILDTTRRLGKLALGIGAGELLFTSGATEGIQTAVLSALVAAQALPAERRQYLLYGATEHKAVPQALAHWNQILGLNAELKAIPVDSRGQLSHSFIAEHVASAAMICTMAVNNETGVWQDIDALDELIRTHHQQVPWLVDGVQALGKRDIELGATSIDYAVFSGHKLYAPKGIGCLYVAAKAPFTPLIIGGGQESGRRSGTENLPGIAALHAVFEMLLDEDSVLRQSAAMYQYRDQLAAALKAAFPNIVFNHDFATSVPTTLNFAVKGVSSRDIMDVFDAANIRVSGGSACSSKTVGSFVLDAMGLPRWQSEAAVRLSFGPATSAAVIDQACTRIRAAAKALEASCLVPQTSRAPSDSDLDGMVQWRFGASCTYLVIAREQRELAIIDPQPAFAERIENLVRCRDYQVKAVISSGTQIDADAPAGLLSELFQAPYLQPSRAPTQQITVGERELYWFPTPPHGVIAVAALEQPQRVDYVCGAAQTATRLMLQQHGLQIDTAAILPSQDEDTLLSLRWCDVEGRCQPRIDLDLGLDDKREMLQHADTLVLDVREQHEHGLTDLPMAAEVMNVPLSQLVQFIVEQRSRYEHRPIVCLCRSGQRSAAAAQALSRHGFTQVKHLYGGLALYQNQQLSQA